MRPPGKKREKHTEHEGVQFWLRLSARKFPYTHAARSIRHLEKPHKASTRLKEAVTWTTCAYDHSGELYEDCMKFCLWKSKETSRNRHAHHLTHRNHVTKYTSQVRMLHLFDSCDAVLQVLQLDGKWLWRLSGISTSFCQVLSCSVYFLHWESRVFGPKTEYESFFRSQISCIRLAILQETKRHPLGTCAHIVRS